MLMITQLVRGKARSEPSYLASELMVLAVSLFCPSTLTQYWPDGMLLLDGAQHACPSKTLHSSRECQMSMFLVVISSILTFIFLFF